MTPSPQETIDLLNEGKRAAEFIAAQLGTKDPNKFLHMMVHRSSPQFAEFTATKGASLDDDWSFVVGAVPCPPPVPVGDIAIVVLLGPTAYVFVGDKRGWTGAVNAPGGTA